jgi:DNA gyrase/topoisomerase IV subunit B
MTTEKEWKKLTPYQQARLRTEMWLGSRDPHTQIVLSYEKDGPQIVEATWVPAVFTAFREIFDNALDETAAHGNGNRVDIAFNSKTMVFVIEDNGRGVPIEWDETEKKYAATVLLSEAFAGRNFEDDRGETRGLNGVGAAKVNDCSEYFLVDIHRDKKHFNQRFVEGATAPVIEDPIILPASTTKTGTKIEFKLSKQVFKNLFLTEEFLRNRIYEAALCYPTLKIYFNGTLIRPKGVEKDLFPKHKPITFEIQQEGFKSNFWLVPNFFEDGSEYAHSMVNAIPMFNGGVHIDAFKKLFFSGMLDAMSSLSKKKKLNPNRSDLADGILIFNMTQMTAPAFDGQAKTRLVNENVGKMISAAMQDPDFFKGVIRRYPEWIESIYQRCADRTQKKDDLDLARMAKKGKREKVLKLRDATAVNRSKCVLFLAEGDSAISGFNEARNAEIHGGLPLRGKVLNVNGRPMKEVYDNEALKQIINSIGLPPPGERINRHSLRYGSVYIATDADEDGKNIAALLVNFFYTIWPELFDPKNPFLYVFETPLIIAGKGKQKAYWYADNYHEFDSEKYRGWDITRAKGLAGLKKADWKYVLENQKLIPLTDDGHLKQALDLIFNDKMADSRKEWIGM